MLKFIAFEIFFLLNVVSAQTFNFYMESTQSKALFLEMNSNLKENVSMEEGYTFHAQGTLDKNKCTFQRIINQSGLLDANGIEIFKVDRVYDTKIYQIDREAYGYHYSYILDFDNGVFYGAMMVVGCSKEVGVRFEKGILKIKHKQ